MKITSNKIHQRKHKENQTRPYGLHASFLPLVDLPHVVPLPEKLKRKKEYTHQSRDPEGYTYQSSDPEGYTYQFSDPEGCTYQSSDPKDTHISLMILKDTPISKVHYPIDEANRYPSVHTKPSTTVTLRRSYYNLVIDFASQIV
ncbi:NBS-LRR type resistance protein [Cucumis melo var. makuwa]|uniref:NBS-LRR type resistance protein n=1 Tax=Cucumis melo var. makuwa TaxID=1194695 RepID=A0A5A7U9F9_CUCMM|nr:NBS-LRR type resistance protein [Cucumis melo var. makuwa]TYK21440.1 NBS-LRR type resistance protein [Cucumis melo var. makuwa]